LSSLSRTKAYLIGRFFAKKDIRRVGDGNPGGSNVWIAGGWKVGLLAAIVDIFKGYLPVALARHAGLEGWSLVPICLAPILGHATQPFLGFRGGKALGATGGAWVALIGLRTFPIYASFTLPVLALQAENAYSALAGMLALLCYAVLIEDSPWLITFAVLNVLLLTFTHRKNLGRPLQLRSWVTNLWAHRSAS
jgi:glycerol-3-phosphate acyltransferase PlsY